MREVKIDVTLTLNFDGRLYTFRRCHGIPVLQMYTFEAIRCRFALSKSSSSPNNNKKNDSKVIPVVIHEVVAHDFIWTIYNALW